MYSITHGATYRGGPCTFVAKIYWLFEQLYTYFYFCTSYCSASIFKGFFFCKIYIGNRGWLASGLAGGIRRAVVYCVAAQTEA